MSLTVVSSPSGIYAASNPIQLKLRKYDWQYDSVAENMDGHAVLNGTTNAPDEFIEGQFIRVYGSVIVGTYEILNISVDAIKIDLDYIAGMASDSGNVINTEAFPLPYVETEIYHDTTHLATIYNSPDINGLITIDFSSIVKTLLDRENESSYLEINFLDDNLSSYFKYRYLEHWQGSTEDSPSPSWTAFSSNIYIVNAAMQMGDYGGGALGSYCINIFRYTQTNPPDVYKNAVFLTKFTRPKYFVNYPFDLSFIWTSGLGVDQPGIVVFRRQIEYDFGGSVLTEKDTNLENDLGYGIHRMTLDIIGSGLNLELQIIRDINGLDLQLIEALPIDIDSQCYDNPIYLCWLNTLGGWDYWLFHTFQEDGIYIENSEIMKRYVGELQTATTQKDIVKKYPEPYFIVGADGLTTQQIEGLKNLAYSPKVMMLINHDEWIGGMNDSPPEEPVWRTVIVNDMTFRSTRSRESKGSVEFEIELPTINIQ